MTIEEIQEEIFANNSVVDLFDIDEIRDRPNESAVNIHSDRQVFLDPFKL